MNIDLLKSIKSKTNESCIYCPPPPQQILIVSNNAIVTNWLKKTLVQNPFGIDDVNGITIPQLLQVKTADMKNTYLLIHTEIVYDESQLLLLNSLKENYFGKVIFLDSSNGTALSKIKINNNPIVININAEARYIYCALQHFIKPKSKEAKMIDEIGMLLKKLQCIKTTSKLDDTQIKCLNLLKENRSGKQIQKELGLSKPCYDRMLGTIADSMEVPHDKIAILVNAIERRMVQLEEIEWVPTTFEDLEFTGY